MLTGIRSNKYLLFSGLAGAGGVVGAVPALLVFAVQAWVTIPIIIFTALWMGICSVFIAWGLFIANDIYNRRSPWSARTALRAALSGLLGGGVAGGFAEVLFQTSQSTAVWREFGLRSLCWGVAGALLGASLTRVIPNLGLKRSLLGGFAGGMVGGLCFVVTQHTVGAGLFGMLTGQMIGLGIMGMAIGCAVVLMEAFLREASLRIVWAPNEVTSVTLGPRTVTIGGGDDTVFVNGLPQHAAAVQLKDGKVTFTDLRTHQSTQLRNGSRLKIGQVEVIVEAAA